MTSFTFILGIIAGALHLFACFLYGKQATSGECLPNVASWGVWAFLSILNALSYCEMNGNAVSAFQFFAGAAGCLLIVFYLLVAGKFSPLKPNEWFLFLLGIASALVWWRFQSATGANMIILFAIIISFVPTWTGVLKNPLSEKPLAWILWSCACFITATNSVLQNGEAIALLTPIALLLSHASVAVLSGKKRKSCLLAYR